MMDKETVNVSEHVEDYGSNGGHATSSEPAELINGTPYWRTKLFMGSFWAMGLGVLACYSGFAMPANTLALINDSIGIYVRCQS